MSALETLLEYRDLGFALLPTASGRKEPNHRVLHEVYGSPEWKPLTLRRASEPEIREWIKRDPDTGVGVLTGTPSGGLVVVDLDRSPPEGLGHPPTPVVGTARGRHIYFKTRTAVAGRSFDWGEIKADGGYVLAPPSRHPSGVIYRWEMRPEEVDFAYFNDLHLPDGEASPMAGVGKVGTKYELPEYPHDVHQTAHLARDEEAVRAACPVLRIPPRLRASFHCPLPGHAERNPSASLFEDPLTGAWRFRDWHRRGDPEWLTLADVRASAGYRRVVQLRPPEAARWYARLFYEAGVLEIVPLELPSLPPSARPAVHKVAKGFALLIGVRLLRGGLEPTPYTRRFAGAWSGVGERAAGEAIRELLRLRVIERVDEHRVGPNRIPLFLPGQGRLQGTGQRRGGR